MPENNDTGHRERLRKSFNSGEISSQTDETILELLLTYSIPQKDVKPLAQKLLSDFGNLKSVLSGNSDRLLQTNGIKEYSATLLKLVDWIRIHYPVQNSKPIQVNQEPPKQVSMFEIPQTEVLSDSSESEPIETDVKSKPILRTYIMPERSVTLMGKAILKEAIEFLPSLPDTESLGEVRQFIRDNMHFNAQETRRRYSDYILRRMFPYGFADKPIRAFAKIYANRPDLKEVCFYRFCRTEPLMPEVITKLLIPAISSGMLLRKHLKDYLTARFPESKDVKDCLKSIIDALSAGGIAKIDTNTITFGYREISLPAFAFVLHSEFPEPGMYDISQIEENRVIKSMLWNPDRILSMLYELRNKEIISKISEIDTLRQFTTKLSLDEVVGHLISSE